MTTPETSQKEAAPETKGKISFESIAESFKPQDTRVAEAGTSEKAKAAPAPTGKREKAADAQARYEALKKMQEGMSRAQPGGEAPLYQLEPEKEFRARSQNYVRQLMNLGGKSQG